MEDVGLLWDHLVSLLMESCPYCVLVIIVYNRVVFLLEGINKIFPSGSWPKNHKIILNMFLTISLPPISDMGKGFKECIGDVFTVGKFLDKEISL
jgi:hypothetical protein